MFTDIALKMGVSQIRYAVTGCGVSISSRHNRRLKLKPYICVIVMNKEPEKRDSIRVIVMYLSRYVYVEMF